MNFKWILPLLLIMAGISVWMCSCGGDNEENEHSDGDFEAMESEAEPEAEPETEPETETDGDTEDVSEADAEPEDDVFPPAVIPYECSTAAAADNTLIDIDPEGSDTQIHAAVALDGEGLWVVYNLPDKNKYFDIYATRISCDGRTIVEPFKVNTSDYNDIDPALAVSGDRLMIVWQSDNSTFPRNLDIYYRVFHIDGTPIMNEDARLVMQHGGQNADFNAWMPQVAAQPGDAFAVVGSWAPDGMNVFQVFMQRIDCNGELDGEAIFVNGTVLDSQVYPSVTALPVGDVYAAWTGERVDADDVIKYSLVPARSSAPAGFAMDAVDGVSSRSSALAADPVMDGRVFLAFGAGDDSHSSIYLKNAGEMSVASSHIEFGASRDFDHTPGVVVGPDGGALVWYRRVGGIKNDVMTQGFDYDGQKLTARVSAVQVNDDGEFGAPYAPAIAHVNDNVYFVVWSQGSSPAFRLKGRFVKL